MAEKNHRLCISCRQRSHRDQLWRIVRLFPERTIQLDIGMGRSAYLCRKSSCLAAAQKKNRLARALKTTISTEEYEAINKELSQRLLANSIAD
ncbi:MAG: YlxR family protein [Cyanobacteria bacterium J06632_3]